MDNATSAPACRYLWKDSPSRRWVIGKGPIDSDVNVPPLPILRSFDIPWCVEDATGWVELQTTTSGEDPSSTSASVTTQTQVPSPTRLTAWFRQPQYKCSAPPGAS